MNRFGFVALSLLVCLPLACDKSKPVDTSGVDPIANAILNSIAQGDAQSVYDTYFTAEYKQNLSLEQWKQIVTGYRQVLGNVVSVKRLRGSAKWIANQFIDGQVVYDVTWKNSTGEVILDVTKEDDWKVSQLRIEAAKINERVDNLKKKLTTKPAE